MKSRSEASVRPNPTDLATTIFQIFQEKPTPSPSLGETLLLQQMRRPLRVFLSAPCVQGRRAGRVDQPTCPRFEGLQDAPPRPRASHGPCTSSP